MKIAFRQGIIRYQSDSNNSPSYLAKSALDGRFIDLIVSPDPTVISFAHGNANYTIEEVKPIHHAWGPFLPNEEEASKYLYWDINLATGRISRSHTIVTPLSGPLAPNNPSQDQHWFDTSTAQMKVWNGQAWTVRIRVFAGIFSQEAIIIPMPLGTQVNLNVPCDSGTILLDDQLKPLRASDQTFLTTETNFQIQSASNNPNTALRFESTLAFVTAGEYIPAFSAVTFVASDTVMLGRYTLGNLIHGIVVEDMYLGDVSRLVSSGIVYNEQWNFTQTQIGKPLFCGATGQITLTPPPFGVCQMIGTIDSNKTINMSIQTPIFYVAQP